jgi:hypothetical protein
VAFVIRAPFFLLFSYLIEIQEVLDWESLAWSGSIVAGIFLLCFTALKIFRVNVLPLLFIAPAD